jgi:lipopolysaccharide export system permease protein
MLYHGSTFETKREFNSRRVKVERFVRVGFDSLFYSFDMSGYASKTTTEDQFSDHQYMLNLSQLGDAIDSIRGVKKQLAKQLETALAIQIRIDSTFVNADTSLDAIPPENIILQFPRDQRKRILEVASSRVTLGMSVLRERVPYMEEEEVHIRERAIEFHGKMSLPLACIIFLFIGAPLGAIIRKGGIGMSIVVSVVLYLAFYVLMIQGKKMATEGVISPFMGAWLPVIVMLPLALVLSLDSTASVRIFTTDNIWHFSRNALRIIIITNPLYWLYRIPPVTRFVHWAAAPIAKRFGRKDTARTFRVRR